MRRRISRNIRIYKYLFLTIGILLIFPTANYFRKNNIDLKSIIPLLIFLIICFGLYYLFDKAKTIEFDNDFIYVIGKSEKEKIPLKNVYKVKLTMIELNNLNIWKIGYLNNDGIKKTVRILPRFFNKHFKEFKDLVKNANKDVIIQNWSHSFDIDQ